MIKIITHTALRMLFIIILLNTAVSFGHNIPINQTFTQDGQVYEFQTPDPVYSCKITGNISLNSEISLIRVILISETNEEFLIYEMFPSVYENSTLADDYYETCYLDGVVPDQIKVQIVDASITINSFNIEDGYIENAVQLQETEKLNIENSRIELLNDYIVENELIWYAGMNSNVEMTYEEKRNLFEDGEVPNFQGMEYYVGGYFSYGTTIPDPVESDIVDNFDWRNRHGANNPSSLYFDGDTVNWSGWIPPRFQIQINNDCYGQGPTITIEALTNLYFNQHLDLDLSQQELISCYSNAAWGPDGSTGRASRYIMEFGIVDETCFHYQPNNLPDCDERCTDPSELIKFQNYSWYNGSDFDELTIKQDIIENGCLVARTYTTIGHAMILVGYGKVKVGDEIFFVPPMDEEIIIPHGSPYIGQTYWIFEQSWGLWNNETTFIYIIIPPELLRIHIMKEPITSLNYDEEDIACLDSDNDGYFNWGIADTKPPTCPPCPPEPDCDDSNPWLGPFDSEYNCQLLCENFTYQPGPYYINSTVTFQDIQYFDGDVIVTSGNEMIVEGEIGFVEGAKLIVQRNAKLTINGGLVTGTCGNLWKGIEVWGNCNQHQSYNYQGAVEIINGGTVENAVCGINTIKMVDNTVPPPQDAIPDYNYTGGLVLCDGGIFKNNRTAVKFWPYSNFSSSSFFRNCQFITDDGLLPGTDPDNFIEMSNISGVHILGGSFTDSHTVTYPNELTTGIEAYNAGFYVWSYSGPSLFTGLYDGIRAYTPNPEKTINIINSQFSNNLRSVYLSSFIETKITGNEFNPWDGDVPEEEDSYCMYLDHCTDYTVEDNNFFYEGSEPDPTGIGLVINNSGPDNNEIYRNDFTNLEYATLAQNCNRDESPLVGLKIKCNDYWDNYQDIAVTAYEEVEYPGIARNQGAEGGTEMQAGNRFSLNDNGIDISDYSTFKESPINYYHHDPEMSQQPRVEPVYISKYINLEKQPTQYTEEQSCPSSQSGGGSGGTIEGLRGDMASSQYKADSTEALLTTLVDGGDSEVLEQEVLQSMPPETYDLYMSLMGKSPYLSDSVLMAAIEKENVLPNVLIKDILVANPQAAKSNEVMDKVEEKSNPLQQDLLAEVLLGQYIVAAKEKLEANVAYYKHRRSTALKYLKQLYRNDTVNAWAKDSLIYLLESEDGLQEKYELIFAYANQDDWIGATNLLNSLSLLYNMNTQQQEIYEEMQQFINVIHGLYLSDSTIYGMTDIQKATLYDLADYSQNIAGAYARGILIETDGYEYTEPIILPGAGLKSGNIVFDLPNIETFIPEHVKIYPNPALDYIIIEMNTGNATGAIVSLFDNQGRPVRSVNIPAQQQHYVLGLKNIPAGMYVLKVDCNGKNIGSKKFSIVK